MVYAKFNNNVQLAKCHIATDDAHLAEENIWGDHLWGSVNGIGKNWLGRILMQVRAELKEAL